MKRFSARDALFMLAPVALLGGLGWMLRDRKPAVITFNKPGPFAPFIKRVQVLPARPVDVFDGYDTRVVVELDARGSKPAWWNNGLGGYECGSAGQLVRVKNGQLASLGRGGYHDWPHLDFQTKSGRWITEYRLKLREIAPGAGQIRLRDTIKFTNNSQKTLTACWLDVPLRAPGVATKMPLVSRVPGVQIESVTLDETPPVESHDGIARWRATWTLRKNRPLAQAAQDGVEVRVEIVGQKGEHVGSLGVSSNDSTDGGNSLNLSVRPPVDVRRYFSREDYQLDGAGQPNFPQPPLREPLWLKGSLRSGESWPLAVRIPLRDGHGKMLFSPRTPQVPFRVVSVVKAAPGADEVDGYGADCSVHVKVQALDPKADISKWKWEANYSQHLRAAVGPVLWELPFKGGKSAIGLGYELDTNKSQLVFRFPLVLGSVPASRGKLVFEAQIAANQSPRVPVTVVVRP